eukprot:m.76246 g.76246  ORF g.76246 m.76246 type:complete len:363 (-) comp8106_c0_seq6:2289-3377(-)
MLLRHSSKHLWRAQEDRTRFTKEMALSTAPRSTLLFAMRLGGSTNVPRSSLISSCPSASSSSTRMHLERGQSRLSFTAPFWAALSACLRFSPSTLRGTGHFGSIPAKLLSVQLQTVTLNTPRRSASSWQILDSTARCLTRLSRCKRKSRRHGNSAGATLWLSVIRKWKGALPRFLRRARQQRQKITQTPMLFPANSNSTSWRSCLLRLLVPSPEDVNKFSAAGVGLAELGQMLCKMLGCITLRLVEMQVCMDHSVDVLAIPLLGAIWSGQLKKWPQSNLKECRMFAKTLEGAGRKSDKLLDVLCWQALHKSGAECVHMWLETRLIAENEAIVEIVEDLIAQLHVVEVAIADAEHHHHHRVGC